MPQERAMFKSWFEMREGREVVLVQISGPCLLQRLTGCEGEMYTPDIDIAYIEGDRLFVRKSEELWEKGKRISCSRCSFNISLPFQVVEAITIMGEAYTKVHRALDALGKINLN